MRAFHEEDEWVTLHVRDTGPGVPLEVRDSLFEPGVTTKLGGWGVGLTLSRRIVERIHGGRIELLDSSANGSLFQIKLPTHPGDKKEPSRGNVRMTPIGNRNHSNL